MPRNLLLLLAHALLASLLAACSAPGPAADPAATRAACGLDPDRPLPAGSLEGGDLAQPIDRPCVEQLGLDLGLDWQAYGREPQEITIATDAADALLTGAFLLLAADLGDVDELTGDPDAPDWPRQALLDEAVRVQVEPDAPAGDLLYAWVTSRVRRVAPGDLDPGYTALYVSASATIWTTDPVPGATVPPWMASVLVHEASHQAAPMHEACLDADRPSGCDADLDGSYGMQAWVLARYAAGLDARAPGAVLACEHAEHARRTACSMVLDPGDAAVCAEASWCGATYQPPRTQAAPASSPPSPS